MEKWDLYDENRIFTGETSKMAARREVGEEIGYSICLDNIRPIITINDKYAFDDYYILNENVDINAVTCQPEEVKEVKWAGINEIKSMIDGGLFVPYKKHFIDFLYYSRNYNNSGYSIRD